MWKGKKTHVDHRNKPHAVYLKSEMSGYYALLLKYLAIFSYLQEYVFFSTKVSLDKQRWEFEDTLHHLEWSASK